MSSSTRSAESTVWAGNLDPMVTEELLYELFLNAGPVHKVAIPKDKISGARHNFAFIEFEQATDADYACKIMTNVKLFNKPIKLSRSANQKATLDQAYHAKLFVGNLDQSIDEHTLYELFVQFGAVLSAKLMTEPDSDTSRGFGFVQFDSFESADAAIAAMDGQYIANRPIHVNYAFKPNSKGERHGTDEERELERQSKDAMGAVTIRPIMQTNISTNEMSMHSLSSISNIPPPPPPIQHIQPTAPYVNQPIRLSLPSQALQQQFAVPPLPPFPVNMNYVSHVQPPHSAYSMPYAGYPAMPMPPGFTSTVQTPPGFPAR